MLWEYKPKDSSIPVLKNFIQEKLVADPERYKRNPKRFIDNTVYDYRTKARQREKLKYNKTAHTSVGNDPVVQNANILADKVESLYNTKVDLRTRTDLLARGVGITAMCAPVARPSRRWTPEQEKIAYNYKKSMGPLKIYIKQTGLNKSYSAVRTKRSRLKTGSMYKTTGTGLAYAE
jgi:hypothetical protein